MSQSVSRPEKTDFSRPTGRRDADRWVGAGVLGGVESCLMYGECMPSIKLVLPCDGVLKVSPDWKKRIHLDFVMMLFLGGERDRQPRLEWFPVSESSHHSPDTLIAARHA